VDRVEHKPAAWHQVIQSFPDIGAHLLGRETFVEGFLGINAAAPKGQVGPEGAFEFG
jgi:hypothetical protein